MRDDGRPIMDQLKQGIHATHEQIQGTPFFQALTRGDLPMVCYVAELNAAAVVLHALEEALNNEPDPGVQALWRAADSWTPAIQSDLECLNAGTWPGIPAAVACALQTAEQVRRRGLTDPLSLMGDLYTATGMAWGNQLHVHDVLRMLEPEYQEAIQYYSTDMSHLRESWRQFSKVMNETVVSSKARAAVLMGASQAMQGWLDIHEALFPVEEETLTFVATHLNAQAGNHPVPQDAREVRAALEAGRECLERFPYLEMRFGDRGRRFTFSDSAWVVAVVKDVPEQAEAQLAWLIRLLSQRGMPSWIMEEYLVLLHEHLNAAIPEGAQRHAILLEICGQWKAMRCQHIPESRFTELALEFNREASRQAIRQAIRQAMPEWAERLKCPGELLISAVVDRANGMDRAVESLCTWFIDDEHYPKPWNEAVQRFLTRVQGEIQRDR